LRRPNTPPYLVVTSMLLYQRRFGIRLFLRLLFLYAVMDPAGDHWDALEAGRELT